jgi:hypothetical protein
VLRRPLGHADVEVAVGHVQLVAHFVSKTGLQVLGARIAPFIGSHLLVQFIRLTLS